MCTQCLVTSSSYALDSTTSGESTTGPEREKQHEREVLGDFDSKLSALCVYFVGDQHPSLRGSRLETQV